MRPRPARRWCLSYEVEDFSDNNIEPIQEAVQTALLYLCSIIFKKIHEMASITHQQLNSQFALANCPARVAWLTECTFLTNLQCKQ
jgi:hypothetical protein